MIPSIDDQIEAKWAEVRAYRSRDSYGPSDIDVLTQIVLEVQELNAVKILMERYGVTDLEPFQVRNSTR